MKLTHILAAGLMMAGVGLSAPASAKHGHGDRWDRHENRWDRGDRWDRGGRHWNRGNHYGWRNHRRCWTEWRHHRRVRICR